MRIAIISTPFIRVPPRGYGGTELFCYELVEGLVAAGHDVTLFATGDAAVPCRRRALFAGAQWPPSAEDDLNHIAWAVAEIERDGRFDLVHTNSPLAVPLTRFGSVPVVHTVHHARFDAASRIYARHPHVFYVAISARQRALEVPLRRARVIHHGLTPARYPAQIEDGRALAHIGRYAWDKGTHLAIDVARAASLPITLAGRAHPSDQRYYVEEVLPRLAHPLVSEVGEVDHEAKTNLLRSATALVCPLQWEEPFGLIAIEAMLCGTPVLGFRRGALPEIVDEGVTGYLVDPGDITGLARRAADLRALDRAACARRARQRFDARAMVGAYASLYLSVLGARPLEHPRAA